MIADSVDRMKMSATCAPDCCGWREFSGSGRPGRGLAGHARSALCRGECRGAAIAQISGEVDHTVTLGTRSRDEALAQAKALAVERAITAGAHPDTVQVIDVEEIPLTYLPVMRCAFV